jgi:16S rRNA (guanine966-N2)-methyltransferase
MLRIITGERRGHKIEGPRDDRKTRPTSDLVRESVFNILGAAVEGLQVVDLFAGTGALGLEALSRGAEHATFVEKYRENTALIARNLATLRYEGRGTVVAADAYKWAADFEPAADSGPLLVLADPPYRDYEGRSARKVFTLLETMMQRLPAGSMIVAEASREADLAVFPDLDRWDLRRYGNTRVAFLDLSPAETPEPLAPQ